MLNHLNEVLLWYVIRYFYALDRKYTVLPFIIQLNYYTQQHCMLSWKSKCQIMLFNNIIITTIFNYGYSDNEAVKEQNRDDVKWKIRIISLRHKFRKIKLSRYLRGKIVVAFH